MLDDTKPDTEQTPTTDASNRPGWTFLSHHAHVLVCLAQNPKSRLRDVAIRVGITERPVQRIIAELEEAGYLTRHKQGRQNCYQIHRHQPLCHMIEMHHTVGDLLDSLAQ